MTSEIFSLGLRAGVLYVVALVVFRGMGKRTLGKMGAFDFAVIIMMGEALAIGMEDNRTPIVNSIAVVVALGILQVALTWVNTRWRLLEKITQGTSTVVVQNGRMIKSAMDRERLSEADLLMELRTQGITNHDLSKVKKATLEPTGSVSVELVSSNSSGSSGNTGGSSSSGSGSQGESDSGDTPQRKAQ